MPFFVLDCFQAWPTRITNAPRHGRSTRKKNMFALPLIGPVVLKSGRTVCLWFTRPSDMMPARGIALVLIKDEGLPEPPRSATSGVRDRGPCEGARSEDLEGAGPRMALARLCRTFGCAGFVGQSLRGRQRGITTQFSFDRMPGHPHSRQHKEARQLPARRLPRPAVSRHLRPTHRDAGPLDMFR